MRRTRPCAWVTAAALLVAWGCRAADANEQASAAAPARSATAPNITDVAVGAPPRDSGRSADPRGHDSPEPRVEDDARVEREDTSFEVATAPAYMARKPADDGVPRVYAKSRNVWVRGRPTTKTQWIGFLWFGSAVPLKSTEPVAGHGCKTWYAIEPKGYVCVDGERATLDPQDPVLQEVFRFSPDRSQQDPHPHYGESIGAERYHHPPTLGRMRAREWDFRFHHQRIEKALAGEPRHESLQGIELSLPTGEPPVFTKLPRGMQEGHKQLIPRSAVAWTKEFTHEGRAMVLADDLTWVPKDRLKIYPRVDFQGVKLGDDVRLPIAFFRGKDRPRYRLKGERMDPLDDPFKRLSWVQLTDVRKTIDDVSYVQTVAGDWVRVDDAVIPEPREETPWKAPVFGEDDTGKAPKGEHTWMQVSILGGWLIAYRGTQPVFTTLMSPGQGGPPHGKRPTLETASTPTGWFKITGKFVTSTMIAPNNLVHSAVPWAQNFSGPYAIHGAYWHNDWGEPKSGGCINLSPRDAAFIFEFTEPRLPPGWHGVRWLPKEEGSTGLIIER